MALVLGTMLAGAGSMARAATEYMNPFDVNQGFTLFAQGDVVLGNNEFEGAVAALGTVGSSRNNYPLVHQVAGQGDYQVPVIDGEPVRLLATQFYGAPSQPDANTPALAITNAGATAGTPEEQAIGKLVDVSNLTAAPRGNFVWLTNEQSGMLELSKLPYSDDVLDTVQTELSSVADYFPNRATQIAAANSCLSTYVPGNELVNFPTFSQEPAGFTMSNLATDRPNVINFSDIQGQDRINRGDYQPTAAAPLVIKFPAGTTQLGNINFQWDASAGAQQSYARYIFLDLSEVTGTVTIDGLTMGAIWAPNAELSFDSNITTNGQWIANNFTSAGAGELHHHAFLGQLPCEVADPEPSESPEQSVTPDSSESPEPSAGPTVDVTPTQDITPTEDPTEVASVKPTATTMPTATALPDSTQRPAPGLPDAGAPGGNSAVWVVLGILALAAAGVGIRVATNPARS